MKTPRTKKVSVALIVSALLGCNYYHESKQFDTFRQMQILAKQLQKLVEDSGIDQEAMESILSRSNGGEDAWGRELILELRQDPPSFVLVSLGRDGQPDLLESQDYFSMTAREIHHDSDADIVFRDGISITFAGK